MITKEQLIQNIDAMEKQGAPSQDIQGYINSFKASDFATPVSAETKPTLVGGISEDLAKRREAMTGAFERASQGQDTPAELGVKAVGQGIGFAFDVANQILKAGARTVGGVVSAVVPNVIETPIKEAFKSVGSKILESPIIQEGLNIAKQGIDAYKVWKAENPRWASDLESVVNIASILPAAKIGKGAIAGAEKVAGVVGPTEAGLVKKAGEKGMTFIQDLVNPIKNKTVKEAEVARTTETGMGPFRKSVIAPSLAEKKMAEAVAEVPNISTGNTYQRNYNAIVEYNNQVAKTLEKDITDANFKIPVDKLGEGLTAVRNSLSENPLITGDAEKTADKLLEGVKKILRSNYNPDGTVTGSQILKARKEYDRWVLNQKPNVFDAKSESAMTIANKEIRNALNNVLENSAPNIGIKKSLQKQSSLYRALENVQEKAATEADTAIGRTLQKMGEVLGTKSKIVQGLAAAVGIGGLGAAATFAPGVAVLGGAGLLVWKAGKLVMKPEVLIAASNALKALKIMTHNNIASGIAGGGILDLIKDLQNIVDNYKE